MTMPAFQKTYCINAPDIVADEFDGETVILNLANGHYYALQGIGQRIWFFLLKDHSPESILASIASARPDMLTAATTFMTRVIELNLVRPRAAMVANGVGRIDEAWRGDSPAVDVYDDLAELIYADPVHDVDEQAGWPKKRSAP
jgi:hypothetical protein